MANLPFTNKFLICAITLCLIFSGIQFLSRNVDSVSMDHDANGNKEVTLEFEGGGIDGTSFAIEVPINASILDASINITGIEHNGYYPNEVTINIGNDEDNDWAFKGKGYGPLGEQNLFSSGKPKEYLKFQNTSFINNVNIMLPRNATVTDTSLKLEGGTGTFDEDYFVAVDIYGYKLSYIKSNGDGSFQAPQSIDTSLGSYHWAACCMADFDNDGDHDVIATDGRSGNMYFYEKTASGNNFKSKVNVGTITTSSYVYDFATGDFNNDGNYDFITSGTSSSLYLFSGNGDGTFTMTTVGASGGPSYSYSKDAADFDNDGNLDLICGGYRSGNSYVFWLFMGNGDGTFQSSTTVSIPVYYAYSIMAEDFNNDGDPDVLAGYYNSYMYFVEGNGDGTFKSGKITTVRSASYSYNGGDAWDYNRDGNADAIVCDSSYTSGIKQAYFYIGLGNGQFDLNGTGLGDIGRCYGGNAPPPRLIGAENAALDIGDVGSGADWSFSGIFEDKVEFVPNFKQKLNGLLNSPTYKTKQDQYGNEFVFIPLNFTSTNNGLLRIMDLRIEYDYTATIHYKGADTIVSELNEHIVYSDTPTIKIYFIVTSSTSGKLKFSDINIIYNIPPDIDMNIPILTAYEDTENLNLIDLSKFFSDTDEATSNLNYTVIQNSQSDHVEVFTNFTNILKIRPITPNWHGETEVRVQVLDSGLKKTYSNLFTIKVLPVNDEPTNKHSIPDVELVEGGKEFKLDLDLRDYFTDIEDDNLYYSISIDPLDNLKPYQKMISAHIEDNHMVIINGLGDFNTMDNGTTIPVPIWIYCDDDQYVNTLEDGYGNFTRQEILVRIQPVNDPPKWSSIPTVYLKEDDFSSFNECLNLHLFLSDDETPVDELLLQVIGNSNPAIDASIRSGLLSVSAPDNYYGETSLTIRASETDLTYKCDTSMKIVIESVNDKPTITILSPPKNAEVRDKIKLQGSMDDVEDTVQLVEIKIEQRGLHEDPVQFDWQQAEINIESNNWTYKWDTMNVPDGTYKITARVYDGELMSETDWNLIVDNDKNLEPVVNITTPIENSKVSDDVLIRGVVYDPDNHGIEYLRIRIGRDMDWTDIPLQSKNGTIDWYFQWDSTEVSDGLVVVWAKANDGRTWSAPATRTIEVSNGINLTATSDIIDKEVDEGMDMIIISILALIVVIIIIGLLVMFVMIHRGNKRFKEYVPEGQIEPLEDVEAKLRITPALSPGVQTAVTPVLPAPGASVTPAGTMATPAALPSATAAVAPTTLTPTVPSLPAATPTAAGPSPALPALPPATLPATASPANPSGGYGLYSPQAQVATAAPIAVTSAGGYQPSQPTATGTTVPTATPTASPAQAPPEAKPQNQIY